MLMTLEQCVGLASLLWGGYKSNLTRNHVEPIVLEFSIELTCLLSSTCLQQIKLASSGDALPVILQ